MEKRLIDANELIQSRPENLNEKYTTELIAAHHKGWNECNKAWLKIIEAQPTAYSIDEIVKQLEGLEIYSQTVTMEKHPFCASEIETVSKKKTIEIVKSGAE